MYLKYKMDCAKFTRQSWHGHTGKLPEPSRAPWMQRSVWMNQDPCFTGWLDQQGSKHIKAPEIGRAHVMG